MISPDRPFALQLAVLLVFSDRLAWGYFDNRQVEEESRRYQKEFGVLTEMARESAWKGSDPALRHKLAEAAAGRRMKVTTRSWQA